MNGRQYSDPQLRGGNQREISFQRQREREEEKRFDNQQRYGGQDAALQGQAIPLNRAGGESYDQGQQMTMEDAIRLASQYGAVPSRISSGTADPSNGYMGVWAIPTAQGWVPLGGSGEGTPPPPPPSSAGAPTSTSDRARGVYGPDATPAPAPSFGGTPGQGSSTPRSPSMPGAAGLAGQGVPGYNSPNAQSSGSIGTPNVNVVVNNTPQPGQQEPPRQNSMPSISTIPSNMPMGAPAMNSGMSTSDAARGPYGMTFPSAGPQMANPPFGLPTNHPSMLAQEAMGNSQRRLDAPNYPGINTGARLPDQFGPQPGGSVTYPPRSTAPWNVLPWTR